MSEENEGNRGNEDQSWREISVSGVPHPVRLKEEEAHEHGLVSPEMQGRTRALGEQAARSLEEREKAGKVNMEEVIAKRGEKEMADFRSQQLRLWKARGGTAEEFNAAWPQMKSDHINEKNKELYRNFRSVYD